jgi:hypothetical protein
MEGVTAMEGVTSFAQRCAAACCSGPGMAAAVVFKRLCLPASLPHPLPGGTGDPQFEQYVAASAELQAVRGA